MSDAHSEAMDPGPAAGHGETVSHVVPMKVLIADATTADVNSDTGWNFFSPDLTPLSDVTKKFNASSRFSAAGPRTTPH